VHNTLGANEYLVKANVEHCGQACGRRLGERHLSLHDVVITNITEPRMRLAAVRGVPKGALRTHSA